MNSLDKSATIYKLLLYNLNVPKRIRNVPQFYSVFLGHPISLAVTLKSDINIIIAISLLQLMNILLESRFSYTLQTRTEIEKIEIETQFAENSRRKAKTKIQDNRYFGRKQCHEKQSQTKTKIKFFCSQTETDIQEGDPA